MVKLGEMGNLSELVEFYEFHEHSFPTTRSAIEEFRESSANQLYECKLVKRVEKPPRLIQILADPSLTK